MKKEKELALTVLGCSDAFCSGGRRQTSFLLEQPKFQTLIDCGATTPLAFKQNGLSFQTIDYVVLSHFHGDHYGGLPFLLLEAAKVNKRKKSLTIFSPPGLEEKLQQLVKCLYPGSEDILETFPIEYRSFKEGEVLACEAFKLRAFPVQHAPESQPHGLRLEAEGKVLGFSGDTSWHENLPAIARGAHLFICECNFFERKSPHHLNYQQFCRKEEALQAQRTLLSHLGEEMLSRLEDIGHEVLEQDMVYCF